MSCDVMDFNAGVWKLHEYGASRLRNDHILTSKLTVGSIQHGTSVNPSSRSRSVVVVGRIVPHSLDLSAGVYFCRIASMSPVRQRIKESIAIAQRRSTCNTNIPTPLHRFHLLLPTTHRQIRKPSNPLMFRLHTPPNPPLQPLSFKSILHFLGHTLLLDQHRVRARNRHFMCLELHRADPDRI
ncbi:hypothetical protein ES702_03187 [subsurface metagenome]